MFIDAHFIFNSHKHRYTTADHNIELSRNLNKLIILKKEIKGKYSKRGDCLRIDGG